MKAEDINTIAVCGAGTMGSGIAQICAQHGFQVILYDINDSLTEKGLKQVEQNLSFAVSKNKITAAEKSIYLSRIRTTSHIEVVVADVIIEAVVEKKEIKQALFQELSKKNSSRSIFATNTSSIPIELIAETIPHPERVVGMHFFNPPFLMALVEVIQSIKTMDEVAQCIYNLCLKLNKVPVRAKDRPGFIVNRIGKMFHTESIKIAEDKIADIETIDALLESCGFKMGPFRLIDLIGVDANLNVTKSLYALMNHAPQFAPSAMQQHLVDEGRLGKKSGKGFYDYAV